MNYHIFATQASSVAWIIFCIIWIVAMFSAKQSARSANVYLTAYRLGIAAIVGVLFVLAHSIGTFGDIVNYYTHNVIVQSIGVALVYIGIGVAVWARFYLGRNWGMPMSEKKGAELVTKGPYAYVRNPIYSGILLAIAGSALSIAFFWVFIFIAYAAYLSPSVFVEEKIMTRLFPEQYPAYKARTKRLIPWVW